MEEDRARSFHNQQESQGFFKNRQYGQQHREYRQNWGPNVTDNDKDEFERIRKENDDRYQKSWEQWQQQPGGPQFYDPVSSY
jgi:hypothetical protein